MELARRELMMAAAALGVGARQAGAAPGGGRYDRAIVIDGLGGFSDPYGGQSEQAMSARGAAELRGSGVTALNLTVGDVGNRTDVRERTLQQLADIDQVIADNGSLFVKALGADTIVAAKREGRIAVVMGFQDTSMIGPDLDRLALYRGLGVRIVQLTYNLRNLSGDGALEPADAGLSKLGRATIARIEAEKLLLDLSHGGRRTTREAIAAATRPLVISHTGCRALNDNPRNIDDDTIRAVAAKGGVVGVYWMPFLVAGGHPAGADLVRHMTRVRNLAGEDGVGIGTDGVIAATVIDAAARAAQRARHEERVKRGVAAPGEGPDVFTIVAEWDGPARFRRLSDGLLSAGWSWRQVEKALGANLLRVYREAWGA